MSPKIHTKLPPKVDGHYSEYQLGKTLEKLEDEKLELWFNVNYIAPVGDCDLIIYHPDLGIYLAEVKGLKLEDIKIFDGTRLILSSNEERQHPVSQIKNVQIRMKNYLRQYGKDMKSKEDMPFLQTTVIWPNILRTEWIKKFNKEQIRIQTKSMMFKDDLVTDRSIKSRLKLFWDDPLLGTPPPKATRTGVHGNIELFREAISPTQEYEIKNDSLSQEIKRSVLDSKELAQKYPPPNKYEVSFEGPPGTGKSTILREIGLQHANAGGSVVHVCFSKVLAAEQRREYQILGGKNINYGVIDVFDEWELYKSIHHNWSPYKSGSDANSPNEYKTPKEVVSEILKSLDTNEGYTSNQYDTILIDESQDMSEALFMLLEKLARPTASWFIAYGKGQEIWMREGGNPAPWLRKWIDKAERKKLRRSFRNSSRAFLMSQNFWENYPDLQNSELWLSKKLESSTFNKNEWELNLELPTNTNNLRVVRIASGEEKKNSIMDIILSAIEDAREVNRGRDLLIGVSGDTVKLKSSYSLIMEILEDISRNIKINILDLVSPTNRRLIPEEGSIRIVRLQNLRGISASHVLLFDLGKLEDWCNTDSGESKGPIQNYGYIALSRSRVSTIVAIEAESNSNIEKFITDSLISLRRKSLQNL